MRGLYTKEPLPRIALVNFLELTCSELAARHHNVYSCPSSTANNQTATKKITALKPAHEIEILLVRDRAELTPLPAILLAGRNESGLQGGTFFDNEIAFANGPSKALNAYCRGIFDMGGLCVFLVSHSPGNLLDYSGLWMATDRNNKAETSSASFRPISHSGYEFLSSFLERWRKVPERYIGIRPSAGVLSFLEDTASNKLVVLHKKRDLVRSGVVLCLPDYGDRSDILDALLREVLPELSPHLFPRRFDASWQNQPMFSHHSVTRLEAEKAKARRYADKTIKKLDEEIEVYKKDDKWLMGLLLTGDDPLERGG